MARTIKEPRGCCLTTRASAAGRKAAPAKSTSPSGGGPPTPRQQQALVRPQVLKVILNDLRPTSSRTGVSKAQELSANQVDGHKSRGTQYLID